MLRLALTLLSPAGARGQLSTLIYHRVLRQPDPLLPELPDAVQFEAQMRWIRQWFNVLPLAEAAERLGSGALPARALAITFDDGYADNEEVAAPILRRLGLHATFFIATGFLDGRNMWNDRVIEAIRCCARDRLDLGMLGLGAHNLGTVAEQRLAIRDILQSIKHQQPQQRESSVRCIEEACAASAHPALMMRPAQVANLAGSGFDVGAHTITHPILARLPEKQARAEIAGGKADLEAIIGRRVMLFAYPNGVPRRDYGAEHVRMVRECKFDAAVSTAWGVAVHGADVFQLPRFTPWDRTRTRFALRLAQNLNRSQYPSV